jgi:hypothetical protein
MPHGIFQSIRGKEGRVTIPGLGAVVGIMTDWSLTRREDDSPSVGSYDLRASFFGENGYLNIALFNNPKLKKRVEITLGDNKQFRLEQIDGMRTVLIDKRLLMEGVQLWQLTRD